MRGRHDAKRAGWEGRGEGLLLPLKRGMHVIRLSFQGLIVYAPSIGKNPIIIIIIIEYVTPLTPFSPLTRLQRHERGKAMTWPQQTTACSSDGVLELAKDSSSAVRQGVADP
jgi:hypothetical protein